MPTLKNPKADLRSKYSRQIKIGLVISLTAMILAFKLSPDPIAVKPYKEKTNPPIDIEPPIRTQQKPDIPPPPKAPQIITANIDDLQDDFVLPDIDDVDPVKLPDKPPTHTVVDLMDEPFIEYAEELPSPVGGIKSLQEKVHYTEIARRAGVEGTVYIEAKIDKNGNVIDAIVKKGLGAGLDDEALNAVKSTKFIPGKQRGKPVNVKMTIPVKFVLK